MTAPIPIRRVRADGGVDLIGSYSHSDRRLALSSPGFPLHGPGEHDVDGDLPWALQDMAPAGYLARRFVAWFPSLRLPSDPRLWDADDVLRALTHRGHDLPGNLIVGDESWDRFVTVQAEPGVARADARGHYAALVDDALEDARGSSVGGDRPKFTLRFADGAGRIVKFSPPVDTLLGRRWADLLRVEAHCAATLRAHGIPAVQAEFVEREGRGYLEVERFDRLAGGGRRGAVTLFWLGASRYGEDCDPVAVAERLHAEGHLSADEVQRLARVHAFSAAIGNTDAHLGNYALTVDDQGEVALAPFYDVLPMAFAPRHDELPDGRVAPRPRSPAPAVRALVDDLTARVHADPALDPAFVAVWLG